MLCTTVDRSCGSAASASEFSAVLPRSSLSSANAAIAFTRSGHLVCSAFALERSFTCAALCAPSAVIVGAFVFENAPIVAPASYFQRTWSAGELVSLRAQLRWIRVPLVSACVHGEVPDLSPAPHAPRDVF